jgi:hypothetical protein
MSHQITLSDAAYEAIVMLADEQGKTPDEKIEAWMSLQTRDPRIEPHYQMFDEIFTELGMSDIDIQQAKNSANIG